MPFLYRRILREILNDIESGTLKPGDRLPTEGELAATFNVSRITAKRAMEELQQQGLIERFRGKGSFVCSAESARRNLASLGSSSSPGLVTGKSIGFVIPRITQFFGTELLRGIEEYCRHNSIDLLVNMSAGDLDTEATIVRTWRRRGVNGMIIVPVVGTMHNQEIVRASLDEYPIVLVDREMVGTGLPTVRTDHYQASHDMTSWMLRKGITRPLCIAAAPDGSHATELRLRGFVDAVDQYEGDATVRGSRMLIDNATSRSTNSMVLERASASIREYLLEHIEIDAVYPTLGSLMHLTRNAVFGNDVLRERNLLIAGFPTTQAHQVTERVPHVIQNEHLTGRIAGEMIDRLIDGHSVDRLVLVPHRLDV